MSVGSTSIASITPGDHEGETAEQLIAAVAVPTIYTSVAVEEAQGFVWFCLLVSHAFCLLFTLASLFSLVWRPRVSKMTHKQEVMLLMVLMGGTAFQLCHTPQRLLCPSCCWPHTLGKSPGGSFFLATESYM